MTMPPIGAYIAMRMAQNRKEKETKELDYINNYHKYLARKVFFFENDLEIFGIVIKVYPNETLKIRTKYGLRKIPIHRVDFYPFEIRHITQVNLTYRRSGEEIINFINKSGKLTDAQIKYCSSIKEAMKSFDEYYEINENDL